MHRCRQCFKIVTLSKIAFFILTSEVFHILGSHRLEMSPNWNNVLYREMLDGVYFYLSPDLKIRHVRVPANRRGYFGNTRRAKPCSQERRQIRTALEAVEPYLLQNNFSFSESRTCHHAQLTLKLTV